MQTKTWFWNTERELQLPTSVVDGSIAIPANTLRVRVANSSASKCSLVQRGLRLYDVTNHTFDFRTALGADTSLKVDIVFLLEFEDLPQAARWYITIKAARRFADGVLATSDVHQYTERDEQEALLALQDMEGDNGNFNVLTDNADTLRIIDRQGGIDLLIYGQTWL